MPRSRCVGTLLEPLCSRTRKYEYMQIEMAAVDPQGCERFVVRFVRQFQIFGGFFVNLDSILAWLQWLKYLSYFRYSLNVSRSPVAHSSCRKTHLLRVMADGSHTSIYFVSL